MGDDGVPYCAICTGKQLVICYTCNAVQRQHQIYGDSLRCQGCNSKLVCDQHKWEELEGNMKKITCTKCKAVKQLAPKGNCGNDHDWQIEQAGASCRKCGVKADLDL